MRFAYTLFSFFLLLVSVLAAPADSVRSEERANGLFIIHEVEEGETLYSIAKRYNGTVDDIISHNNLEGNRIEIAQTIAIKVQKEKPTMLSQDGITSQGGIHIVQPGETLYRIGKKYDIKLKELRRLNNLANNDIQPGMQLVLRKGAVKPLDTSVTKKGLSEIPDQAGESKIAQESQVEADPYENFKKYLVQTGETLATIARKMGVSIDSLKSWNGLSEDYLKIGQSLWFKEEERLSEVDNTVQDHRVQMDDKGFNKVHEEGLAGVIEGMKTTKYLALHRSLPIGTSLKVRNLMNNQVAHVKVIGRLPDTGLNKKLMVRVSLPAYEQLGILDSKSRVEVSYHK